MQDIEVKTEVNVLEKLENYKKEGYLFHGSFRDIDNLVPRKAKDMDRSNVFNNDNAIFATDNIPSAIIFGVVSRDYLPEDLKKFMWSTNWSTDDVGNTQVSAKVHKSWEEYIKDKGIGYVYVLPPQKFREKSDNQFKSKVAVKPIDKVEVTLEDFYNSGGKLILMDIEIWD